MALPDLKRSMIRIYTVPVAPGTKVNGYVHATTEAAATVLAAGYFNFFRDTAKVGDQVTVICGVGGTVDVLSLKFLTVPSSGNVTTGHRTGIAALTDSSTGTADGEIEAISGSGADGPINNNFAELTAKINALLGA